MLRQLLGFLDACIIRLGIVTQFHMQLYTKANSSANALECSSFIGETASYAIGSFEKWLVGLVVGLGIISIVVLVSALGLGVFVFFLVATFRCTCPWFFLWVTAEPRPRAPNRE